MKKIITRPVIITVTILLIPLISMQFSKEIDWKLSDFIIMGALVFGASLAYEFLAGKTKNTKKRTLVGAVLLAVLLIVWAEIAVGIFGTPFAGS